MTLSSPLCALCSALREDPDAFLVGEMRDLETIRLAMTAARNGEATWCSARCTPPARHKTIDHIIDVISPAGR